LELAGMAAKQKAKQPSWRPWIDRVVASVTVHQDTGAGGPRRLHERLIDVAIRTAKPIDLQKSGRHAAEDVEPFAGDVMHVEMRHVAGQQFDPFARVTGFVGDRCWQHRGHRDQLAPLRRHHRTGQSGNGAAVEASGEKQTGGVHATAQPAGDSLRQHAAIGLDIVGFVAIKMHGIRVRGPIAAHLDVSGRRDGHDGAPGQAEYLLEMRIPLESHEIEND
jgi:hypothetical protein